MPVSARIANMQCDVKNSIGSSTRIGFTSVLKFYKACQGRKRSLPESGFAPVQSCVRRLRSCCESTVHCPTCHSSCTSPFTRFGNNQRVSGNNWQRLSPPMLVDQSTTHCRAARTIAGYIHRPNRTTAVRTARARRRTSLCNLRAHSFAQCRNI